MATDQGGQNPIGHVTVQVEAIADAATRDASRRRAASKSHTTPAGLQANATLFRRRVIFFTANALVWVALMLWTASVLSSGGWQAADIVLLICVGLALPWPVMGLCNATIGLALRRVIRQGGVDSVAPFLAAADTPTSLTTRTAVLMTLRNEDPERAIHRLKTVKASLDATGEGAVFSYFVLSDTNDADIARREEAEVNRWKATLGDVGDRVTYRRRLHNDDYKAGNIRAFCERFGGEFTFMLPLDADSLMTGPAIVRLVRIMQSHPRIGILQSLVVGLPSASAFARIFQFGMRHGMRSYTLGQAWWTGDCGPYWGHNALVRIAPFIENCVLPKLKDGRPILSHDQVEATFMRRAGYEVRVMPFEDGSYEDNPPSGLEFMRRDLRWCQGNMQYTELIDRPGLYPVSRFQLVWAVLMFACIPAVMIAMIAAIFVANDAQTVADFPVTSAAALYLTYLFLMLTPKLFSIIDTLTTPGEVRRFGGPLRYLFGIVSETVVSFFHSAAAAVRTSIFMAGLPFGKSVTWSGQQRDAVGVGWGDALAVLWPALLFGVVFHAGVIAFAPGLLLWMLPLSAGFLVAIPMTVFLASPAVGAFFKRHGLSGIPEDFAPPSEIAAVEGRGHAR